MSLEVALEELRRRRSAKWTEYPADVLPAWVAEMDFTLAPPVAAALQEAIERGDAGYANPAASRLAPELAGFAQRRLGWRVDPAQVVTTNDVVGGLVALLRALVEPGDGVVISPPVYHPFFSLVPEAGCSLVEVPLAPDGRLDVEGIDAALAAGARAVIVCNPQNPTGRAARREVLEELGAVAARRDAWVLSDEIHAPLTLPGAAHVPFVGIGGDAAARGVSLVSASKAFNLAGLGCAQIVTAAEPARSAVDRLTFSDRHCGHLGLLAAEAAYRDGDGWLDELLAVLDANRRCLAELLADRLPEARYEPPQAGYLAWIDLSAYDVGPDPGPQLLERGRLAVSPGPQFGAGGEGRVRLNIGTSTALVEEAVERMATALGR